LLPILGSVQDAEDLVQETLLGRPGAAHERFEGRSSLRTWLYRIATKPLAEWRCAIAAGRGTRALQGPP